MMDPSRFLASLAQALSTMALYKTGHPARERVIDRSFTLLQDLLAGDQHPEFSFLGDEVIYGKTSLRDLRDWNGASDSARSGFSGSSFEPNVSREDFADFLESSRRGCGAGARIDTAEARQMTRQQTIRFGEIGIRSDDAEGKRLLEKEIVTATINYGMGEEIDAIKVHARGGAQERRLAVARGRSRRPLAVRGDARRERDDAAAPDAQGVRPVHHDALPERLGADDGPGPSISGSTRAMCGPSAWPGCCTTFGKVKVPMEILNKPGKLTDEERA